LLLQIAQKAETKAQPKLQMMDKTTTAATATLTTTKMSDK